MKTTTTNQPVRSIRRSMYGFMFNIRANSIETSECKVAEDITLRSSRLIVIPDHDCVIEEVSWGDERAVNKQAVDYTVRKGQSIWLTLRNLSNKDLCCSATLIVIPYAEVAGYGT